MRLPQPDEPFRICPFQPETDFPSLVTLLSAVEAVDQSGEETTEAQQREQMNWPGHDLSQDRFTLVSTLDSATFLGYGDCWHMPGNSHADIALAVHPDYRRRGFGGLLLQHLLARAQRQGVTAVHVYADFKHAAAHAFFQKHHFRPQGAFVELFLRQNDMTPQSGLALQSQYTVLPNTKQIDAQLLTELMNTGYADLFGHKVVTEDYVRSDMITRPHHSYLLLQSSTKAIVGLAQVYIPPNHDTIPKIGYLDAPGILPGHRQPMHYHLLAQAGVHFLQQAQVSEIVMESWGDEPEVIAQYCELGFTIRRHFLAYEYVL